MSLETEGFDDFEKLLVQMGEEFGYTDANKKILIPAVRKAMQGMNLQAAGLARKDTGTMAASISVDARKPKPKDYLSKYVDKGDAAIAVLSVRRSKVSLGEEFGTANKSAHPFIMPTFESNLASMEVRLGMFLRDQLKKYIAKKTKDKPL